MIPGPAPFLFAGLAGLALGSFAVTAGVRLGRGQSVLRGRSACDHCSASLGYSQTLPLVSHLRLRGACSTCGGDIDPIHLAGEIAGAAVLLAATSIADPLRAGLVAVLGLLLITSAAVDWTTRRLPDALTLIVAVLGAGLALRTSTAALLTGLIAALVAFALLEGLRGWGRRRGRDPGLGFGDVKLVCALALWLGLTTPWMIVAASLLGLGLMWRIRPGDGRLAFGPAIAVAALLVGVGGEWGWWPTTA